MSSTTCTQSTGSMCQAPAGTKRETGDGLRMVSCYRCGGTVCRECSSTARIRVLTTRGGTARWATAPRRICDGCLEQEPDGEARLMLLQYHRAGYPTATLECCRETVARRRADAEKARAYWSSRW